MEFMELVEIQVRHVSGDTPIYEPHQLREVLALMASTEDPIFKIILTFKQGKEDYTLTLREVSEGKWILYGDPITPPTGVEVFQALAQNLP